MVTVLLACRCQTYVTDSRVFPLGEWEKCLMCVSGRLKCGLIRWTGKYDNISFRIKTSSPVESKCQTAEENSAWQKTACHLMPYHGQRQ